MITALSAFAWVASGLLIMLACFYTVFFIIAFIWYRFDTKS